MPYPSLETAVESGDVPPGIYGHGSQRLDVCAGETSSDIQQIIIDGHMTIAPREITPRQILQIVKEHTASNHRRIRNSNERHNTAT